MSVNQKKVKQNKQKVQISSAVSSNIFNNQNIKEITQKDLDYLFLNGTITEYANCVKKYIINTK